jgi:nitrous oxidase accessory protein NosD
MSQQYNPCFAVLRPSLAPAAIFALLLGLAAPGEQAQAETTAYSGATEIDSLPYEITQSGTYYLAQDLVLATNVNGIHVAVPNVTIDFNGHTISQSYGVNINTCGVGIDGDNVTVINGAIKGFFYGVIIGANSPGCRVEDMYMSGSTFVGLCCQASNGLIRRCRIFDTGGSPVNNAAAVGVQVYWSNGVRVLDCDISMATTGVPWPARLGINPGYSSDTLVVGNRINGYDFGVYYGTNGTGKYRDNTTASVGVPYTGGTDAGGNN